ncbi:hypothetical protein [Knoellia sp. LjRoot47]|uniref:hypothetical protein n=1 Tax=Knoellia sp. LjRoot47 TaxID=3342330 RepID=UPI003ED0751C
MSALEPARVIDPPKGVTIFGREPAMVVGFIEALLALALSFAAFISGEQAALVMAVVSAAAGFYVGYATKDVGLARVIGLIKAVVALAAGFGFAMSDSQQGALMAAVAVGFSLINRDRTSPVADPVDPSPQQVTPVLPTEDVASQLIPGTLPTSSQTFDPHIDDDYSGR